MDARRAPCSRPSNPLLPMAFSFVLRLASTVSLVVVLITPPVLGQEECYAEFITYTSDGLKVAGVMMKPPGDGPFPAVIWNHGSRVTHERDQTVRAGGRCTRVVEEQRWVYLIPERRGYGASEGESYSSYVRRLNLGGIDAAVADANRLWQEADDVVNGMEFLKTLPFVDPRRVALVGVSHGGMVSLFAAAKAPGAFAAVVDQAGGIGAGRYHVEVGIREMVRAGSRVGTPILIQHGRDDLVVPVRVSIALRDGMARAGKDVTLRIYPGSHYIFDRQPVGEWGRDLLEFLHDKFGR